MSRTTRRIFRSFGRLLHLENRIVPALTTTFSAVSGMLSVTSDAADAIVFSPGVDNSGNQAIKLNGAIIADGMGLTVRPTSVTQIQVTGGPGNNNIDLHAIGPVPRSGSLSVAIAGDTRAGLRVIPVPWVPANPNIPHPTCSIAITGGAGDDTITGSQLEDYIDGGLGVDSIIAGEGDDEVVTEGLDSLVVGSSGRDRLRIVPTAQTTGRSVQFNPREYSVRFAWTGIDCKTSLFEEFDAEFTGQDEHISFAMESGSVPAPMSVDMRRVISSNDVHHNKIAADFQFDLGGGELSSARMAINTKGTPPASTKHRIGSISIHGTTLDDEFTVTPDAFECTIDGGAGVDELFVNHDGLAFTSSPTEVKVAGRSRVILDNCDDVIVGRQYYDVAASAALQVQGVFVTASCADASKNIREIGIDELNIEVENKGMTPTGPATITWLDQPITVLRSKILGAAQIDFPTSDASTSVVINIPPMAPGNKIKIDVEYGVKNPRDVSTGQSTGRAMNFSKITYEYKDSSSVRYELSDFVSTVNFDDPYIVAPVHALSIDPVTGKTPGDGGSKLLDATAGGIPLMLSTSTKLDPAIATPAGFQHLYLGNVMVDVSSSGTTSGDGSVTEASVDDSGRFVTFVSAAPNLVAGLSDTNGVGDVFLRDMTLGTTVCLTQTIGGGGTPETGNGASSRPQISGDGTTVVYESLASDLIPTVMDTNGGLDLFKYYIASVKHECMSVNVAGTSTGDKGVFSSSISDDGQTIAWLTEATDVNPAANSGLQIVMKTASTINFTKIVFKSTDVAGLTISGSGFSASFWTDADVSAVAGVPDTNNVMDLLMIETATGVVTPLSTNVAKTAMANGATPAFFAGNDPPAISYDGSTHVFTSNATDLVPGGIASDAGVYRGKEDLSLGFGIVRIDQRTDGSFGSGNAHVAISPDDRIAWLSKTNYQSNLPLTFGAVQGWTKGGGSSVGIVMASGKLVANNPLYQESGHTVSNPLYTSRGLMFRTNGALDEDSDDDTVSDVYLSANDRILGHHFGNNPDNCCLRQMGGKLEIVDMATMTVVASRVLDDNLTGVFVKGLPGVANTVEILLGTGMSGLHIDIDSGGGGVGDVVNVSGDGNPVPMKWDIQKSKVGMVTPPATVVIIGADIINDLMAVTERTVIIRGDSDSLTLDKSPTVGIDELTVSSSGVGIGMTLNMLDGESLALAVDWKAGGNLTLEDSWHTNSAWIAVQFASDGPFIVDASTMSVGVTLIGGDGTNTFKGGSGSDTFVTNGTSTVITGGAGNDTFMLNGVGEVSVSDSGGTDTLDFERGRIGVLIDDDFPGVQTISSLGGKLTLASHPENFIGSDFDDSFAIRYYSLQRSVSGRSAMAGGTGNALTFDAQGVAATDMGDRIVLSGGVTAVAHSDFQQVSITNNSANQVVHTDVNNGAAQRSMVTSLLTSFNFEPMWAGLPSDAFEVVTKVGGVQHPISVSTNTVNGFTHVTITPLGSISFVDGRYLLRVKTAQIVGGLAGGDYSFEFHRIFGDITGDANVASNDFIQFRLFFNGVNPAFDFNGDGAVAASDFIQFRLRFNGSV